MTTDVYEDATKWRNLQEYQKAQERHAQLVNEVKLLVVAPLTKLYFEIRDNPDRLPLFDLSTFPEKSDIISRQSEMAAVKKRMSELAPDGTVAGVKVFPR